jgi:hypothetical protein
MNPLQLDTLPAALSVLSAMVTPAVLILASSSLVLATSNRLGRAIDRTRAISERIADLARESDRTMLHEERALLLQQLGRTARRANLLTRTLTRLYMALALFIATSVGIGVVAVFGAPYAWAALLLGFLGAGLLFWASVLLIVESRIALAAVEEEMAFVRQVGTHYSPPANLAERPHRRRWGRP